jgi:two-component system, sensor histidine kinase and response regulator
VLTPRGGAQRLHHPPAQPLAPVVLVAEDNEINWAVAKALLARHGVRSVLARDGLEAVQMVREHDYAAVLMDCQMPGLDGYAATARIRDAEGDRHLPIIAMTAHTAPGDRERCLAAGMDDYLAKPVRVEELAAVIGRWISGSEVVDDAQPAHTGRAW